MAIEDLKRELDETPGLKGSMARWAALGAVVAIPLPIVGPVIGGLAGAAWAYHKGTRQGGGGRR